jgi:DNA-binding response OmpR family regulator
MPSNLCPCCRQKIADSPLRVSLEFNTVICGNMALEIEPRQAELVYVLRKHWPRNVHNDRLISQVWGAMPVDEAAVRTTIYQTRKALEPIGYTIRNSRKQGYRLEKMA